MGNQEEGIWRTGMNHYLRKEKRFYENYSDFRWENQRKIFYRSH